MNICIAVPVTSVIGVKMGACDLDAGEQSAMGV